MGGQAGRARRGHQVKGGGWAQLPRGGWVTFVNPRPPAWRPSSAQQSKMDRHSGMHVQRLQKAARAPQQQEAAAHLLHSRALCAPPALPAPPAAAAYPAPPPPPPRQRLLCWRRPAAAGGPESLLQCPARPHAAAAVRFGRRQAETAGRHCSPPLLQLPQLPQLPRVPAGAAVPAPAAAPPRPLAAAALGAAAESAAAFPPPLPAKSAAAAACRQWVPAHSRPAGSREGRAGAGA